MTDRDIEAGFWKDLEGKKKKRLRPTFKFLIIALSLFLLCGFGGYKLTDMWLAESLRTAGGQQGEAVASEKEDDSGIVTVLFLGIDQRDSEPSRADTIMLAFIDKNTDEVRLLSIPRDTYVSVPGYGRTKINHATSYGGPELMTETVSDFLEVPVSRYVQVDFNGFENIVDTLGGVEMEVEQRMYYSPEGIDLREGRQHLDGDAALQYVRYRGTTGDIGRVERQQKFLAAFAEQSANIGTIFKVPGLIKELRENTETNLTLREMLALSKLAKESGSDFETAIVPGESIYIDQVSYWRPYSKKTAQIVDEFFARNEG